MHADELRMAVTKVVEILEKANIGPVLNQYRAAQGDQRTAAAARLGHAGAVIMERLDSLSPAERQVTRFLHLESLGSAEYWQNLLGSVDNPKVHQAEIVRLASRVMFASNHLPGLVNLMGIVKPEGKQSADAEIGHMQTLEVGEGRLNIRLTDAGERASDPDRVARAIDGIDMLYSACASIARKPAIDLRLDGVFSKRNRDRDLLFTGERDSMAAVYAVIDSIPEALSDIDPEQDIDLDAVVRSLPIFEDLNTLASLGTFSKKDLKDISDTMHQGALLTLESGVILIDASAKPSATLTSSANDPRVYQAAPVAVAPVAEVQIPQVQQQSAPAPRDEHYERYVREREAMLKPGAEAAANAEAEARHEAAEASQKAKQAELDMAALESAASRSTLTEDQSRRDAVDELLKTLGQSRSSS